MNEHPIRTLTAREIECRVAMIKNNGLQLLLYKDARCDMAILDEAFGPFNWKREHTRDNNNCIVSIWDDSKQVWVSKEDVGTESNTEAQKGLASDSFKRACVNWGIGRELYTAPFIWIAPPNCEIKEKNGRLQCFDRFEVTDIGYDEHREINRLVIINGKTRAVVYQYGASDAVKQPQKPAEAKPKETPAPRGKRAEKPADAPTMATDEQKEYIRQHATDADYLTIMQDYGADLERMTHADALNEIAGIDKRGADTTPKCERCGKIITGLALPDGSTMTASELVGKSKIAYGGIYCYDCMKALKNKRKAG